MNNIVLGPEDQDGRRQKPKCAKGFLIEARAITMKPGQ